MLAAADEPRVAAVWEDSGYADTQQRVAEELEHRGISMPGLIAPAGGIAGLLVSGVDIYGKTPLGTIGRLAGRPLFIAHGLEDLVTPVHHAQDLFDAARRAGVTWSCGSFRVPVIRGRSWSIPRATSSGWTRSSARICPGPRGRRSGEARVLRVENCARHRGGPGVGREQRPQVVERPRHVDCGGLVMSLDRHQDIGRVVARGACGALPPAPAAGMDDAGLVGEDHLAGRRDARSRSSPGPSRARRRARSGRSCRP